MSLKPPPPAKLGTVDRTAALDAQAWFALSWGIAALFHLRLAHLTPWSLTLTGSLVAISAVWAISQSRSRAALLTLASTQILDYLVELPRVSNHETLQVIVAAGIVVVFHPLRHDIRWQQFQRFVRYTLAVVYFWGTAHKLNSAFLHPETSCAAALTEAPLSRLGIAELFVWPSILGTLLFEGGATTLLLTRFWPIAVRVAVPFHFIIGFTGFAFYMDFSAVMFALFLAMANAEQIPRSRIVTSPESARTRLGLALLLGAPAAAAATTGISAPLLSYMIVWALVGTLLGWAIWRGCRGGGTQRPSRAPVEMPKACLAILGMSWLLGWSPYLGLKTEGVFSMYSNLRTEGESNHLLIPHGLQVFGYQDPVFVLESNVTELPVTAQGDGHALTRFVFWSRLAVAGPAASVTYEIDGQAAAFLASNDEVPAFAESRLLRKLLDFKPVQLERPNPCTH